MHSVSYIINGISATQHDIDILNQHYRQLKELGVRCEYILYSPNKTLSPPNYGVSIITSASDSVSLLQKAIATSCGDRLVFTTLNNIHADTHDLITQQACDLLSGHITVPVRRIHKVLRMLGIRQLANISYIISSKQFASAHTDLFSQPDKAVLLSDKILSLQFIQAVDIDLPDVLIKHLVFVRPYYQIAKRIYSETKHRLLVSYRRWRDERLSRNVPAVHYESDMPVFIVCRDRLTPLKKLVKWCEDEGLTNLIFIDNDSTYPPLLEYLSHTRYEVIRLQINAGHTSPWTCGACQIYANNRPFIVTDPDIIPTDESHGAVKFFCEILTRHPERRKAGFGLKIDDLPNHYALKEHVLSWEKQFWVSKIKGEEDVYDAEIDTTFAVYRHNTPYILGPSARTGGKYTARHEPWYIDSDNIPDEVKYYRERSDKVVGSWGVNKDEATEVYLANKYKNEMRN